MTGGSTYPSPKNLRYATIFRPSLKGWVIPSECPKLEVLEVVARDAVGSGVREIAAARPFCPAGTAPEFFRRRERGGKCHSQHASATGDEGGYPMPI